MEGEKPIQLPSELLKSHEKYGNQTRLRQVGSNADHVSRWADFLGTRKAITEAAQPQTPEELCELIKREFNLLKGYGVTVPLENVFPLKSESGKEGVFVVVKDVVGTGIQPPLNAGEEKEYVHACHTTWKGLFQYFQLKINSGAPFLFDIHQEYQYIWGKTDSDLEDKLYLVDVDPYLTDRPTELLQCMMQLSSTIGSEAKRFNQYPELHLDSLADEVWAECERYRAKIGLVNLGN